MDTSQTNPTMHSVPLGQLFVVNAAICCLTIMSCMLNIKWVILTERLSKHIVENSYQYPVSEHAKLYLHGSTGRSIKPELIQISFKQKQLTLTVDAPASTQPETRKLQQVCCRLAASCDHQADIRMRSHRLLRLDDNKSAASCQQAYCKLRTADLLQVANGRLGANCELQTCCKL